MESVLPHAGQARYSPHADDLPGPRSRALAPLSLLNPDRDPQQQEAFLLAGIVSLLVRILHKETVHVATVRGVHQFVVDLEAPFSSLLQSEARISPPDGRIPDASLIFNPGSEDGELGELPASPVFCIHREGVTNWSVSLESPAWSPERSERALVYLVTLLESADHDPSQAIGTLPLLSEREALLLYRELNATTARYPEIRVEAMVTEQAQIAPATTAVVFADRTVSYASLEDQSTQLAASLASQGADQEHPVALILSRSEQIPKILLATLKAGSFFVPLDPAHPTQRLVDMLEECKPAAVIVDQTTASRFEGLGLPLRILGEAWEPAPAIAPAYRTPKSLDDTAYMIYTSGTTGKPKGVKVSQRALVNFLNAAKREPGLKRGDRLLAIASLSFDISMLDMFLPLYTGATLVIASEQDPRDPARLAQLLEEQDITYMGTTATTWRMLISHGWRGKRGLRMQTGGEALPRNLANALVAMDSQKMELWNCYGPTETTIFSSCFRVHPGDGPVPIGAPIDNTGFYIADAKGRLLPPEIAGELYIGGDSVAQGYFERPELNARKFISNPWTGQPHQRLFCTGDAARFREDGALDFFGRLDEQVKLRGFRIELGEIEATLRRFPSIEDAAVVLREDAPGEPWLVAYLTRTQDAAGNQALDAGALRTQAAQSLPAYMIPARYVELKELPLSANGKIDKRALQAMPAPLLGELNAEGDPAADEIEATLLRIFREVLRSPSFGPEDNFFDHGGYSLLVVRLFARIANALGTEMPITTLFDAPTVRQLAKLLHSGTQLTTSVAIRSSGDKPPFFLVQSYLIYGLATTMVPEPHPVFGLRETESFEATGTPFDERVSTFVTAIDRVHPHGPIHIGGWCAAATLTLEIVRRLQEMGRPVGLIALFDAEVPGFDSKQEAPRTRMGILRAAVKFHLNSFRARSWKARFQYLFEKIGQHCLRYVEWIYMRHRGAIVRLQQTMPFLPNVFFYNRWTQLSVEELPRVRPIDARVVLFRASEMIRLPGSDETLGWASIARGGVEVIYVPGDHESMFKPPHLSVLSEKFTEAIAQADANLSQLANT
jgi:amino acid adenylation domain-containing protein